MNDSAIKTFCTQAREMLEQGVERRMRKYGIVPDCAPDANASVVGDLPLSPVEREQRGALLRLQSQLGEGDASLGHERLLERAAYTWFNRMVAIRFMELRDYLPSRVRMFSNPDGTFGSQAVGEALDIGIEGLDINRVLQLKQESDDDELFRYLLLAQCQELSACIPDVFEPVDAAMGLLLPEKLSKNGSVVQAMVESIPEEDWLAHVEILGWMYQYYNADAKDAFFKSKAKATPDTLPVATQLFTPEWIVRYMVQNSLGRLWMLNNPQSAVRQQMEYYIEPDSEQEDFILISGPEEITLCDPACGSGHILVYAFELLFAMYEERGYREREIPQLILQNNLSGLEIDPRAAQIASLALAMCAREHDRRFFGRGVRADINVVAPTDIAEEELPEKSALLGQPQLLEALAHLDEIGSLLNPSEAELSAVRADAEAVANAAEAGDMFAANMAEKLQQAKAICKLLSRRYACVVANPPYMGSSSFSPFMSRWVKKNYPDVKSDLCTCFIERGFSLANEHGYAAMVTMQSWMFLGSFEKMRGSIIANKGVVTMAHLGPRAFDAIGGEVVSVTADVIYNGKLAGEGAYVRLVDINGSEEKRLKLVEAIQNPTCGWFYRRDAQTFTQIPGTPIAYWASDGLLSAFANGESIDRFSDYTGSQNKTGDNARYLRLFWEVPSCEVGRGKHWASYSKGGDFRRWYGNMDYLVDTSDGAISFYRDNQTSNFLQSRFWFNPGVSYTMLTSSKPSFRFYPATGGFDMAGPVICGLGDKQTWALGFLNSSVTTIVLNMLNPTLNLQAKDVKALPFVFSNKEADSVESAVNENIDLSKSDWDSFETSWGFKRHPLL